MNFAHGRSWDDCDRVVDGSAPTKGHRFQTGRAPAVGLVPHKTRLSQEGRMRRFSLTIATVCAAISISSAVRAELVTTHLYQNPAACVQVSRSSTQDGCIRNNVDCLGYPDYSAQQICKTRPPGKDPSFNYVCKRVACGPSTAGPASH